MFLHTCKTVSPTGRTPHNDSELHTTDTQLTLETRLHTWEYIRVFSDSLARFTKIGLGHRVTERPLLSSDSLTHITLLERTTCQHTHGTHF